MATTLYLWSRTVPATSGRFGNGQSFTTLASATANRNMSERRLMTTRDGGVLTITGNTVAGPTNGVELEQTSFSPTFWLSEPLAAGVTISGSVTFNFWGAESNMSANVAINGQLFKVAAVDGALTEIVKTARTTELAVTTPAVNNFSATPGAGVALDRGDRLALIVFGDDSTANMASGHTFNITDSGTTGGADGDSFITLTENLTFESAPAGSVVYLTDTSAGIDPGSATEKEAWTSRGAGATTAVTNTAAGPTSAIQVTATAGGTAVEWYTKPLTAMTLSGPVAVNLRGRESAGAAAGAFLIEIARVNGDGSSPTVWGINTVGQAGVPNDEASPVSEQVMTSWISGADLTISAGQRIRIKVSIDDAYSTSDATLNTMATGNTLTMWYAGTSGGASGDTFLTFSNTLTEFVAGPERVPRFTPYPQLLAH